MKKRLLSLLLILCLCAALLPVTVFAEDNVTIVTTEAELKNAIANGGSVKLGGNIVTGPNEIKNVVTIDLNGYSISLASNRGQFRAFVISNGGHLTLTDSSANKNGEIINFCGVVSVNAGASFTMNGGRLVNGVAGGSGSETIGGGVRVNEGGTFEMNGGSIENCTANGQGGGVYVSGTFRMTGGTIQGCKTEESNANGGGVFVAGGGTFEMSGGSIKNCCALNIGEDGGNGGGVYVSSSGTFKMSDGTITGCTARGNGSGVYVADSADAILIPENITGNTKKGSGETDNIVGSYEKYIPPIDPIDPDYPLISILPALAKDLPFADVTSTDWFYNDVKYAYETGLMTGTSADTFSPEAPVTRGMVMTILARREGIRTDRYTPWYAAGCEWAKSTGISDGTNPEAPVTREQLAAMLYRYAALKGRDLTAGENLNFTDASDISDYAIPALQWATGEAILTGSNGALHPQAPATRAQLAAILHRYFG